MKKTSNKIVFFGSGPVAAKSLDLLLKHQEVEAIITKPSTLKQMSSITNDIPLYSVGTRIELDELINNKDFESRLGILIDFGIIISKTVIDSFELGIINSHFSLLPQWRGADPITFSILSGQKQTGVSLMLLVEAMDEGPILARGTYNIKEDETTPSLTHELILLSDALLKDTVQSHLDDLPHPKTNTKIVPIPQEEVNNMLQKPLETTYSRKLTKKDGILDFSKSAVQLEREIRAYIEWPKSRTTIAGKDVIVTKASVRKGHLGKPGIITQTDDKNIYVNTKQDTLIIEELKPAGKKTMSAKAFLAGYGNLI